MAQEQRVKFTGIEVGMIAFISCPDCDTSGLTTFSFLTLDGAFLCPNPKCQREFDLQLVLPDTEKAKTDEMLRLARGSIQQSRSIDWSGSEIRTRPPDPKRSSYRRPMA